MMSKMDMSPEELETVKVSRRPTTVITANGSVDTTEEVTFFLKEMDMFVPVQLLEDTPVVLSLGKTLRRKWYSYEWNEGQNPNLIKNNKMYLANATTSRVQHKIQQKPPRSRHWMITKRRKHRDIDCRICQNG